MKAIATKHNLDFEARRWWISHDIKEFRVGTCNGLWFCTKDSYVIMTVCNSQPNNGHLDDVFEWFERSCKRDKKALKVTEIVNKKFYMHLITRRGFTPIDKENVIKIFTKNYKKNHERKNFH
jgi:hypothetical protein